MVLLLHSSSYLEGTLEDLGLDQEGQVNNGKIPLKWSKDDGFFFLFSKSMQNNRPKIT